MGHVVFNPVLVTCFLAVALLFWFRVVVYVETFNTRTLSPDDQH